MLQLTVTAAVAALTGAVIGALYMSGRRADELATERVRRRATDLEIADLLGRQDADNAAQVKARQERAEQKTADDAEFNRLADDYDELLAAYHARANQISAHSAVPAQLLPEAPPPLYVAATWAHPLPEGTGHTEQIRRDLDRWALDVADNHIDDGGTDPSHAAEWDFADATGGGF